MGRRRPPLPAQGPDLVLQLLHLPLREGRVRADRAGQMGPEGLPLGPVRAANAGVVARHGLQRAVRAQVRLEQNARGLRERRAAGVRAGDWAGVARAVLPGAERAAPPAVPAEGGVGGRVPAEGPGGTPLVGAGGGPVLARRRVLRALPAGAAVGAAAGRRPVGAVDGDPVARAVVLRQVLQESGPGAALGVGVGWWTR